MAFPQDTFLNASLSDAQSSINTSTLVVLAGAEFSIVITPQIHKI